MALLPFLQELWLWVIVVVFGWLVVPVLLTWRKRFWTGFSVSIFWVIVFGLVAYGTFEISARSYHPNRNMPMISAFLFLMAASAVLVSVSFAAIMAISAKRQRVAIQAPQEDHS